MEWNSLPEARERLGLAGLCHRPRDVCATSRYFIICFVQHPVGRRILCNFKFDHHNVESQLPFPQSVQNDRACMNGYVKQLSDVPFPQYVGI